MTHPFATLLIPAHHGAMASPERVSLEFSAVSATGVKGGDIVVSDSGNIHFAPVDGGPTLRVSLADLADACLKASRSVKPAGAA